MKILFAGCSFVYGAEVERHERFSYLVSQALGAEELNVAQGGRSNAMSAYTILLEAVKQQPDYIVFGLSYNDRTFVPDETGFNEYVDNEYLLYRPLQDSGDMAEVGYQMSSHPPNPHMPMKEELLNTYSLYRNRPLSHLEKMSIVYMLKALSETSGIPMCIFPSVNNENIVKINDVDMNDTILAYPPNIPQWFDIPNATSFKNLGYIFDDFMPGGHPGPRSNKYFADVLVNRIKKDLRV